MLQKIKNPEIRALIGDPTLPRSHVVETLNKWQQDKRAEQRLASEGGNVDDDGLNSDLRDIELALELYGSDPSEQQSKNAASL